MYPQVKLHTSSNLSRVKLLTERGNALVKKVKVKGGNTDIPAEKPDGYKGFVHDNSGPNGADNFKSTELDPDNPKIKLDNAYDVKELSDEGADLYFKSENDKINKESINTNMAKKKIYF